MKRYQGPCQHCGVDIDRTFRPGRDRLCIDCAIEKSAQHNRALAAGVHPSSPRARVLNNRQAEEIRARKGPWFEKWKAGMERAMANLNDTDVA